MSLYERPVAAPFHLLVGDPPLNEKLDAAVAHVIVDNWSNQYLQLPDAGGGTGRFIGPGDHGGVYGLRSTTLARAQWAAPFGQVQPPIPVGAADLIFLSEDIDAIPMAPASGQGFNVPTLAPVEAQITPVRNPAPTYKGVLVNISPGALQVGFQSPGDSAHAGSFVQVTVTGLQTGKVYLNPAAFDVVASQRQVAALDPADLQVYVLVQTASAAALNPVGVIFVVPGMGNVDVIDRVDRQLGGLLAAAQAGTPQLLAAAAVWTQLVPASATRRGIVLINNTNAVAYAGFGQQSAQHALAASSTLQLVAEQCSRQALNVYLTSAVAGSFPAPLAAGLTATEFTF